MNTEISPPMTELPTPEEIRKEQAKQFLLYCLDYLNKPFYDEVVFNLNDVTGAAGREEAKALGMTLLEKAGWCLRQTVQANGITKLLHISAPSNTQYEINCVWLRNQCLQKITKHGLGDNGIDVPLVGKRYIICRGCPDPITFVVADSVVNTLVDEMNTKGWQAVICQYNPNTRGNLCFLPADVWLKPYMLGRSFKPIGSDSTGLPLYLYSPIR